MTPSSASSSDLRRIFFAESLVSGLCDRELDRDFDRDRFRVLGDEALAGDLERDLEWDLDRDLLRDFEWDRDLDRDLRLRRLLRLSRDLK